MRPARVVLALVGLVALLLAYLTGSIYLLVVAVIAFIVGLYLMGMGRRANQQVREKPKQSPKRKES